MPRPAPTPPDFDDNDDLSRWDDGDNDMENRPAGRREEPAVKRADAPADRGEPEAAARRAKPEQGSKRDEPRGKREETQPASRRGKADPALAMPPVQKEEALGLGGKKPAPREPSLSAGEPFSSDHRDTAPVLEAPTDEAKPSPVPDDQSQKIKRAARADRDVGGLLYLIALAIFAAALSAAVVLMFF
jgi:hypothetical protein